MNSVQHVDIPFSAGGQTYTAVYKHGVLDESLRDTAGFQLYYQGSIPTQGIDVRIGGRTIATRQINEIWDVQRHNAYNNFVGELIIPGDVPRQYLRSVNNKSAYDLRDGIWQDILHSLGTNYPPPREARATTERELRDRLADNFSKYYANDEITREYAIWASAVQIDIYRKEAATGEITIYETKAGQAQPLFIYQLRMYWDGLALASEQPTAGVLVCASFTDTHQQMIARVNEMSDPGGTHYNLSLKLWSDFNL